MAPSTIIFAPHVDDEVLGCFSFLEPSTHVVFGGVEDRPSLDVRLAELESSAEALGFSYNNLGHEVNRYESQALISPFDEAINEAHPDTVLIPEPSYNQDHRAVFEAAMVAVRPHDHNHRVDRVLLYEQPHSVMWPLSDTIASPNVFVPIDIEAKLVAYQRYASQVRGHRSFDTVRALAGLRGSQIGSLAAEAFTLKRLVVT